MRSSSALLATACVATLALTGCVAAEAPATLDGHSVDAVTVTGSLGEAPGIEFPTPLNPSETECDEIIVGDGAPIAHGQTIEAHISIVNGATGQLAQQMGYDGGAPALIALTSTTTLTGLLDGMQCGHEGSRVVIASPAKDAFGEQGVPAMGITGDDPVVFVVDIGRAFPAAATGRAHITRDAFPAVVLAPDGRPGITMPQSDPPATLETEILKKGDGAVISEGDQVLVKYTGVTWTGTEPFDTTWGTMPKLVTVGESTDVPPGFSTGLLGHTVGSQVGIIVPPEFGFSAPVSSEISEDSTLFYVVDILGIF